MRRLFLALLLSAAAFAAAAAALAPHRAEYRLSLRSARGQSVTAASGTMAFDLQDTCGGMLTTQHLAIDLTDRDGAARRLTSDYATFERRDGRRFEFHSRQDDGADATQVVEGTAGFDAASRPGSADYTSPVRRRVALPRGTLLPNAHTGAILDAARAGTRFLSLPLFDGTSADGAQDTFVTLGNRVKLAGGPWPALARLGATRVHVSFFDRAAQTELPDFDIAMRYFDNGVADDLVMDFGDFVMQGELTALTPHAMARC